MFVDAGGEADRYDAGGLADNLAAVHAEHPGEVGVVMDLSGDVGDGLRAFGYFPWRSSPPQQPEDPEAPDAPEDESNGPRRF